MDRKPDADAALEQRISRLLSGTAAFKAPQSIEARVLEGIERRGAVPWWQRRVPEWPLLAQGIFALTGVAAAAALMLGRPAATPSLGSMVSAPAADLHATLGVLAVFRRLADTMAGALPDAVWYGGILLCGAAYFALLLLIVFGYRLLQTPASR